MDEFVSTYQKDFNWPFVKTFPIRTERQAYQTPIKSHCICGSEPGGAMPPKEYVGPIEGDTYQWSRLGPMAPLLDPKLYPAKVGPAPEFEITRHDQPNTYLKKLQERYPYLYNVLQSAPPDELIRRVNEDRLRTTYQMDYSHMDEHPSADYEKLLARAGVSVCSKLRSSPKENLPILDCRSKLRPPEYDAPIQPTSLTLKILARSDAGGFPMDPRDHQEREYHRGDEFDARDIDNEYLDGNDRPVRLETVQHHSRDEYDEPGDRTPHLRNARDKNDYDEPGDRSTRPRNAPDKKDHREPNRNGAKRSENVQDRGGNAKSKNHPSGTRDTATRGNEFKGDRSSGTNGARGGAGNRGQGHGGRGEEGATRPADLGVSSRASRPADGGDARPPTDAAGSAAGGGSATHEGGGTSGGGRGNEGGGHASKKSTVGFGSGEESQPKSKKAHRAKEEEEASKKPLPAWQSEYQEVIGQTGTNIIKDKIHQHGGRSGGRRLMERVIMKCPT